MCSIYSNKVLNKSSGIFLFVLVPKTSLFSHCTERLCPVNQRWYRCKPCLTLCGVKAFCSDKCVPGCACKPGYAKQTLDSQCIPEDKCIICKGLQVNTSCFGHCPPTCEPKICTAQCIPGCICKEGFVWHNERCIPGSMCPKTLPA
ncbi:hypothetical protein XELAEV_18036539mg [Xenopus laevis]|uniref:TIL domain-containing protein n=1 Tax=Xenopus laevis TaxID=8355 RepID=A0A974CJ01_XENLA|nr:hypothetical protein XELAEV_18036539mg [Xenopus laevis]